MKIAMIDPSAYTPPYDHALCAALGELGADVELLTSRFPYGTTPPPSGYRRIELFYKRSHAAPAAGPRSRLRLALKLAEHVPDMVRCRSLAARAEIAHYQWLPVQPLDIHMLPRRQRGSGAPKLVLTAHDVMPREPRPGQLRAQRRLYERFDAIVVHSEHGRGRLTGELGIDPARVHVIPHGAFTHLAQEQEQEQTQEQTQEPGSPRTAGPQPQSGSGAPLVLFFGLLRPYKGLDLLLDAWRALGPEGRRGAELWIVGMPRMELDALDLAQEGVTVVPRFVDDDELPIYFQRAKLVVLPYREIDQSGVLFTALAFGRPLLLSDVGGFPEIAATGAARTFPAGDAGALRTALAELLDDEQALTRMGAAAAAAAQGLYAWKTIAKAHLDLYRSLL
ncbi:MAG TPA: glycosyltransferase family 4 protein [Solirubrobacteraceae bacterium]